MNPAKKNGLRAQDYFPLLQKLARYHYNNLWFAGVRNIEEGEFISEGFFGLNKAIQKFNPEKSPNFERYAFWMIRYSMLEFLRKKKLVSTAKLGAIKFMKRSTAKLEQELGRPPYETELAQAMGFSLGELRALQKYDIREISLDKEMDGEESTIVFSAQIPLEQADMDTQLVISIAMERCLRIALEPIERRVLQLLYMQGFSVRQVVEIINQGVNQQRIYYLERRGLAKIKKCMNS